MVSARGGARSRAQEAAPHGTRDKLAASAERLMLRDGYSGMRVDDVLREAGLSKGSFYHFFVGKEALALAALDRYFDDRVARLSAGAYAAQADPLRRARGFLDHASRVAPDLWSAGCLLASLAADAAASSRAVSKALRARTDELRAMLAGVLGPLAPAGTSAAELAEHFLVCIEGAIVLARIHDDPGRLRRAIEQFRRGLEARNPAA